MYVTIGGIEQWVQIHGDRSENPVLLFLHGGPGGSSRFASAAWKPWERCFRVVHWDQRGAGLTFARNGEAGCGALTIDRMVADGIELVEFLRSSLAVEKVLVVGHSWGSILGVHMIKRRPDLFSAYVGTGQFVDRRRNEAVNYSKQLAEAKRAGNQEAVSALTAIGPPPYADLAQIRVLRQWADRLATGTGDAVDPRPQPMPTDISLADADVLMRGFAFSTSQLFAEIEGVDLRALSSAFEIPMFIFHATDDQQTPIELAEEYFTAIRAPHKEFVRFEGCHHFVVMNRPDDFLRELATRVLPQLSRG